MKKIKIKNCFGVLIYFTLIGLSANVYSQSIIEQGFSVHQYQDTLPTPVCRPQYERNEVFKAKHTYGLLNALSRRNYNPELIKKVKLSFIEADTLPEALSQFENLEELTCLNCILSEFPVWLSKFKKIKVIRFSNVMRDKSNIKSIPYPLSQNPNLEELNLEKNELTKIPEGVSELKKLRILNLNYNRIQKIPDSFVLSNSVKSLQLMGNKLERFPVIFNKGSQLEFLDLSRNNIEVIDNFISSTSFLRKLKISNNPLQILPNGICMQRELKSLEASYINLKKLPSCLVELVKLKELDLAGNHIKELPKDFKDLRLLYSLNLMNNPISELPFKIEEMYSLKNMHLFGTALPSSLQKEVFNSLRSRKAAIECQSVTSVGGIILSSSTGIAVLEKVKFKGTKDDLKRLYSENFQYPNYARANNIEGQIIVSGEIDENGSPVNLRIVRSPGGNCAEAFIEMLNGLKGAWYPAIGVDNKPRRVAHVFKYECKLKE